MRLTERKVCYPECDKQGNLTKVDYIEIKNKGLAEEKLCQLEDILEGHNIEELDELDGLLWYIKRIKDIEDELGIDLITLFKGLKNGVYYFANGTQLTKDYVWLLDNYMSVGTRDKLSYSFMTAFERQIMLFKDYGKTWALTKEELEQFDKHN